MNYIQKLLPFLRFYKYETFKLVDTEINIGILKAFTYNPIYFFYNKFKDYIVFKFILKFILRIPYWLVNTVIGGIFTQLCFIWALVGREPITLIFSILYVTELLSLMLTLKYFLHLEGVYAYCLKEYGPYFMEKYIGNPVSQVLAKKVALYSLAGTLGFGADQYDRSACHDRAMQETQRFVDQAVNLKKDVSIQELLEVHKRAALNNLPRMNLVSDMLKESFRKKG